MDECGIGELPMLHDGKNWIAGTNRIIAYLSKTVIHQGRRISLSAHVKDSSRDIQPNKSTGRPNTYTHGIRLTFFFF
jgi:hypothetical protein